MTKYVQKVIPAQFPEHTKKCKIKIVPLRASKKKQRKCIKFFFIL